MPPRGRPIKPIFKPRSTTSHVIHEDGTYSNTPTKVSSPPVKKVINARYPHEGMLRVGEVFTVKATGAKYQVTKDTPWGVYVMETTSPRSLSVSECAFWDYEKVIEETG
jgi:hypothetical protein